MKRSYLVILYFLIVFAAISEDRPIITVLDFQTDKVSRGEMRTIISLLSSFLFKTGKYTVIDIQERNSILQEIEFSLSDCSDEACQIEVGKMLSAEMIVIGNIGRSQNKYIISSKILETGTGKVLNTADGIYPDFDSLATDISKFGSQLSGNHKDRGALVSRPIGYYLRGVVPGLSQYYAGNKTKGYIFMGIASASAIFVGYTLYDYYSKQKAYDDLGIEDSKSEFDSIFNDAHDAARMANIGIGVFITVFIANLVDLLFLTKY